MQVKNLTTEPVTIADVGMFEVGTTTHQLTKEQIEIIKLSPSLEIVEIKKKSKLK